MAVATNCRLCEAFRIRVRRLDVFRFGTAIRISSPLRAFDHPGPIHHNPDLNPAKDYPVQSSGYLPVVVGRSTVPHSNFLRTAGINQDSPVCISRMLVDGVESPLEDQASSLPLARHSRCRKREEKRNPTRMSRKIPHILCKLSPGLLPRFLGRPTRPTHARQKIDTGSAPLFQNWGPHSTGELHLPVRLQRSIHSPIFSQLQ